MTDTQIFMSSAKTLINTHYEDAVKLLSACHQIANEYAETKSYTEEEQFNVFTLISDQYYKENFHSDIMAFLLDPTAVHGHKSLMLDIFIGMLNRIPTGHSIDAAKYHDAIVVREKGRIDILIKSESSKRAIIIENKINNAGDMFRQLPRYYDYVIENYKIDAIVYLPLDYNKSPNTDGWSDKDKIHIKQLLKLVPAYDQMNRVNVVKDWLQQSLKQLGNSDVISAVRQYAQLIKLLNNNNMDTIILEKFRQELLQADNLRTALSIRNMLNEMPIYMAHRIQEHFGGSCYPFEKVWIYSSKDAVFEKVIIDGIYMKMDIWCYEERYDVVFWSPNEELEEGTFFNSVGKIHVLEEFEPKGNVKNQIVRHFSFSQEPELFDFIRQLLKELKMKFPEGNE